MSIFNVYQIFFNECQYKIAFYFDHAKIIKKIQVTPFTRISSKIVGKDLEKLIFEDISQERAKKSIFKAKIFRILVNSSS